MKNLRKENSKENLNIYNVIILDESGSKQSIINFIVKDLKNY